MTTIPKAAIEAASQAAYDASGEDVSDRQLKAAILAALPHLAEPVGYMTNGSVERLLSGKSQGEPVSRSKSWANAYHGGDRNGTRPVFLAPPAPAGSEAGPITKEDLADALDCFWNAAIGEAHNRQAGMDVASILAEGINAVSIRLKERAAMLAAAPEPPANSQGSLDGSEPMMTDEEITAFIKENGQPEDVFPYLLVPVPTADPVNAQDDSPVGWLFFNPDAGVEFSENHPIESGEVPDAENIREATSETLLEELLSAWKDWEEDRQILDEYKNAAVDPVKAQLVEALKEIVSTGDLFSGDQHAACVEIARAALAAAEEGININKG